jgi:DNA-binding response OmpR family regulator
MAYKLLVVDDDSEIAGLTEKRLFQEGYEVFVAGDGIEALEKVRAHDPDVILLDLGLPKLSGFEVLKEIREKHSQRWRAVIVISARGELEAVKLSYELQADHYLTKPVTIEKVLEGIETMISLIPLHK